MEQRRRGREGSRRRERRGRRREGEERRRRCRMVRRGCVNMRRQWRWWMRKGRRAGGVRRRRREGEKRKRRWRKTPASDCRTWNLKDAARHGETRSGRTRRKEESGARMGARPCKNTTVAARTPRVRGGSGGPRSPEAQTGDRSHPPIERRRQPSPHTPQLHIWISSGYRVLRKDAVNRCRKQGASPVHVPRISQ